jgi:hypothetical protein
MEMKWIEMIRVRSAGAALEEVMPSLIKQIREIESATTGVEMFFMQHTLYDGDLAVVVVWMNDVEPQQTREGLMVAEHLQGLGPIDHAVWIPAEKDS